MQIVIGAVLKREEGYAFDAGSLKAGFPAWVAYRRIEDASNAASIRWWPATSRTHTY
jgi:hypothetical protein